MLIAKLRVSVLDSGISYNSKEDLDTTKSRGTVLEDGKVVRGLGTSFRSKDAKDRYDRLVSKSNKIRDKFNQRFLRTPIQSTFVISTRGEAKNWAEQLNEDPEIDITVFEFELDGLVRAGLDPAFDVPLCDLREVPLAPLALLNSR